VSPFTTEFRNVTKMYNILTKH